MQQTSSFHHAEINGVLGKDVFEHQIAATAATLLYALYYLVKGDWRSGIKNKIKINVTPIFVDSSIKLTFKQQSADSFLYNISFLNIERPYFENMAVGRVNEMSRFAETPFGGRGYVYVIASLDKLAHEVGVNAAHIYVIKPR